jgi:energy-converting hydrogenase Eha subunit C
MLSLLLFRWRFFSCFAPIFAATPIATVSLELFCAGFIEMLCTVYYHLVHIVVCNHNVISTIHFFIYAHVPILSWIHCVLAHFINVKQNTFFVTAPNACFHSYQSSRHVLLRQKFHYFHHRIHHIWIS